MPHPPVMLFAALPLLLLTACSRSKSPTASAPATPPAPFLAPDSAETRSLLDNLDQTHITLLNLTGMRLDLAVLLLNTQYPQKINADWATLQNAGLPASAPVTLHAENLSERQLLEQLFEATSAGHPSLKLSSHNGTLLISLPPPPAPDRSIP